MGSQQQYERMGVDSWRAWSSEHTAIIAEIERRKRRRNALRFTVMLGASMAGLVVWIALMYLLG